MMDDKIIERNFAPGSNWLYCKLYLGSSLSDKLLSNDLRTAISSILLNHADLFFFIRYTDPEYHLRLRFRLVNTNSIGAVISLLYKALKPYLIAGHVWKVQYDTYEREIERYGIETITESEGLFFNDSIACLEVLGVLLHESIEKRVLVALKMIHILVSSFRVEIPDRMIIMEQLTMAFKKEFGIPENSKQLNQMFRQRRLEIEKYIKNDITDQCLLICDSILKRKMEADLPLINAIINKTTKERKNELLRSYIHMMMNRLFVSKQRMMEVIVYDLLRKYYRGDIAKRNA